MKTECQVVYDNLKSVRRLLNIPFMDSQNKYGGWKSVNVSYVEVERIDDALELLKRFKPLPIKEEVVNEHGFDVTIDKCPTCDAEVYGRFCAACGQAVKW